MGDWSQDGDVENNERKTLPERPQRSHWKFNYKYHIQVSKSGTTFLVIVPRNSTVAVLRELFSLLILTCVCPFAAACANAVSPSASTTLILVCGSVSKTARTSVLPSFAAHIRPVIPS
jgi:hypothetical protein